MLKEDLHRVCSSQTVDHIERLEYVTVGLVDSYDRSLWQSVAKLALPHRERQQCQGLPCHPEVL